jgi:hypothetical protein
MERPVSDLKARGYAIGLPLKWFKPKGKSAQRSGYAERRGLKAKAAK